MLHSPQYSDVLSWRAIWQHLSQRRALVRLSNIMLSPWQRAHRSSHRIEPVVNSRATLTSCRRRFNSRTSSGDGRWRVTGDGRALSRPVNNTTNSRRRSRVATLTTNYDSARSTQPAWRHYSRCPLGRVQSRSNARADRTTSAADGCTTADRRSIGGR